jgi:hypothetical protein
VQAGCWKGPGGDVELGGRLRSWLWSSWGEGQLVGGAENGRGLQVIKRGVRGAVIKQQWMESTEKRCARGVERGEMSQ